MGGRTVVICCSTWRHIFEAVDVISHVAPAARPVAGDARRRADVGALGLGLAQLSIDVRRELEHGDCAAHWTLSVADVHRPRQLGEADLADSMSVGTDDRVTQHLPTESHTQIRRGNSLVTTTTTNSSKLWAAAATICPAPLLSLWAPKRLAPPSRRQRSISFPQPTRSHAYRGVGT